MHQRFNQCCRVALPDRFDDVDVAGRESNAHSRFREINHCQSDEECGGCNELKIDQRFHSHTSDFSQRTRPGDSRANGRENKRRYDRLDEVNENIAQKINFVSPIRPQPTNRHADDEPNHDLHRERWAVPRPARNRWSRWVVINIKARPETARVLGSARVSRVWRWRRAIANFSSRLSTQKSLF